ncbi:MAG: hypothetical protein OEM41_01120 [Ignavibacteria bacterium]|nr:hypothetical protein [Ignavibacteria bacterium]
MTESLHILQFVALSMVVVAAESGSSQSVPVYSCEEVDSWGDRNGEELFAIGGLAVSPDNTVYATDSFDYSVKMFAPGKGLIGRFGRRGRGPQEFSYPYAIAVQRDTIAVVDIYSHQVRLFLPDGTGVRSLRSSTSPFDVGFDRQGNVWVASVTVRPEERVVAYDRTGRRLRSIIIGSGDLRKYLLETVILATNSMQDMVVLATVFANRLCVYDPRGRLMTEVSIPDLPERAEVDNEYGDEVLPVRDVIKDIAVDQKGNIFVLGGTESPHKARDVYILSPSGRLQGRLLLPFASNLVALDGEGFLYGTANDRTVIKKYRLKTDREHR